MVYRVDNISSMHVFSGRLLRSKECTGPFPSFLIDLIMTWNTEPQNCSKSLRVLRVHATSSLEESSEFILMRYLHSSLFPDERKAVLVLIRSWFEFGLITFKGHLCLILFAFDLNVKASPANPDTARFCPSLFPSRIYSPIITSLIPIRWFIRTSILMAINSSLHSKTLWIQRSCAGVC